MFKILIKTRTANLTIEFSVLMVIVILAFISMQAYLKRGVQGGLRRQIDQFAPQFSYEYGNVTTRTIESTRSDESVALGIASANVTQALSRTTDEAIEPSNVESRIGI